MAKRLGELLIEAKVISQEQLDLALSTQRTDGRKLGHVLCDLQLVTETQLTQALSRQLSVPWVSLYHIDFSRSILNLVPRDTAEKYSLVPIYVRKVRKQGEELYVAMDDPTNEGALAEVAKASGLKVKPMIACPSDIKSAIRVYYGGSEPAQPVAAPASTAQPPPAPPPPKKPDMRSTVPDGAAAAAQQAALAEAASAASAKAEVDRGVLVHEPIAAEERESSPPMSEDHPYADPEIEAVEIQPRPRRGPRMVALTLLDGTTLQLPAVKKRASRPDTEEGERVSDTGEAPHDQLTARDLISAFRAVTHGADASEILGEKPPQWEAMFATLLSLLLKKGIIADWEFIDEFRKI